jgi:hypothetical protein
MPREPLPAKITARHGLTRWRRGRRAAEAKFTGGAAGQPNSHTAAKAKGACMLTTVPEGKRTTTALPRKARRANTRYSRRSTAARRGTEATSRTSPTPSQLRA